MLFIMKLFSSLSEVCCVQYFDVLLLEEDSKMILTTWIDLSLHLAMAKFSASAIYMYWAVYWCSGHDAKFDIHFTSEVNINVLMHLASKFQNWYLWLYIVGF